MTDFHPATTAIETIIGPHLTRDCARELARAIVENLLHTGWLQPADLTMPAIVAHPVGASAPMWRGGDPMADIMTEAEIAELRDLEAAATTAPWTDDAAGYWADMPRIYGDGFLIAIVGNAQPERGDQWDADAKFIRAARNAVPRLLAMIEAERAEVARLREAARGASANSTSPTRPRRVLST